MTKKAPKQRVTNISLFLALASENLRARRDISRLSWQRLLEQIFEGLGIQRFAFQKLASN
jgi:hypothetical protein